MRNTGAFRTSNQHRNLSLNNHSTSMPFCKVDRFNHNRKHRDSWTWHQHETRRRHPEETVCRTGCPMTPARREKDRLTKWRRQQRATQWRNPFWNSIRTISSPAPATIERPVPPNHLFPLRNPLPSNTTSEIRDTSQVSILDKRFDRIISIGLAIVHRIVIPTVGDQAEGQKERYASIWHSMFSARS